MESCSSNQNSFIINTSTFKCTKSRWPFGKWCRWTLESKWKRSNTQCQRMDSEICYGQLILDFPWCEVTSPLSFRVYRSLYPHQLRTLHLCPQFCYKNNKSFVRVNRMKLYFLYRGEYKNVFRFLQRFVEQTCQESSNIEKVNRKKVPISGRRYNFNELLVFT